jgi:dipeptidyl aminopeptidase/acylaminoacyl peptidase
VAVEEGSSPDGRSLLVLSSRGHLQQHLPWLVPADGGEATTLATRPGAYNTAQLGRFPNGLVRWSPDGARLTLPHSGPDEAPGVWLPTAGSPDAERPIWSAAGDGGVDPDDVCHMETVSFPSADGTLVPGLLITARNLDTSVAHPALTYHYGGSGQQATLGWALARKSVLFNYLAARAYVVLITDCRGGEGYGDDYAKGLWHDGGGAQADDLAAGARFLAGLGYVDPGRIGIFGHGYGAYLAVQTMVRHPGVFRAGVAMAGVYDWTKLGEYGTYVRLRFGDPGTSADRLHDRSPVRHLDRLDGALLVVHGDGRLQRSDLRVGGPGAGADGLDKEFGYMTYPGQPHDWIDPDVERNVVRRTEAFLARHLTERVG